MPRIICFVLFVIVSHVAFGEESPLQRSWIVDGVKRSGLVYMPLSDDSMPSPVVFAFHGHGGTALSAARSFRYHQAWPQAIVVYLQGLNTPGRLTDPEGKKPGWQSAPGDQNDRDLRFFDAVLSSLLKEADVDDNRVYATGHSNGGGFTYLLWSQRGDVLAAVAPSASAATRAARNLSPKPTLHVAGKNDPLVKYAWQQVTIEKIRKLNGCDEEAVPWDSEGDLTGWQYPSTNGTPVITLLHNSGHKFLPETSPLIVKFFQSHQRTSPVAQSETTPNG